MARRQVLGKGIHALIAEHPQDERNSEQQIIDLPVDVIAPNPHQPRTEFDNERLQELAGSIREKGLLQPIVVNRTTPDSYHLIAGERRAKDRIGELQLVTHNPDHQWYWYSAMTADEAMLIKTYDSATDGRARRSIHTAFVNPRAPAGSPPRESMETRTLAFFDDGS